MANPPSPKSKALIDLPQNSPNKTPKTVYSPSPSHDCRKFSKLNDESSTNSCGICLSEEGKSVRGYIDSCDHYFCFLCIMEWSKVESRCPLCKRRFSVIRRPVKPGVFATERIVSAPVRDQAYHHFGIVTTGPQNPYAEVQCTVCHSTSDDALLLLCDLCDSASHTYCVGLGATVPEGDWLCGDCAVLRDEHAKDDELVEADGSSSIDPNWGNQASLRTQKKPLSAEASVSIYDILRGSLVVEADDYDDYDGYVVDETSIAAAAAAAADTGNYFQSESLVGRGTSEMGARTLQRCRDVQGRIHALRENWDKIRSGSLSFSSSSISEHGLSDVPNCVSSQPNSPSSLNQQEGLRNTAASNIIPVASAQDIDKAWKMMDAAKSIEGKKCAGNVHCSSTDLNRPLKNNTTPKGSGSVRTWGLSSCNKKDHDGIKLKNHQQDCLVEKQYDKRTIHLFEQEKFKVPILECNPANRSLESSKMSTKVGKGDKAIIDSDAKSEIQSLVKLNLKLLSKEKKLDTNTFKEVARLATHSILAACGIETSKRGVRTFPSSICSHVDKDQQVRRSTLMPGACRECFFTFVKDVVNTFMVEKTRYPQRSC